jgi:hypothetical protein
VFFFKIHEHSGQARAPHTNGPRNVPWCGALCLLLKPLHYRGVHLNSCPDFAKWALAQLLPVPAFWFTRYFIVVPRPLPAAALVARRRYLAVVPRPMPVAPRRYLAVVQRPSPAAPHRYLIVELYQIRSLCIAGT